MRILYGIAAEGMGHATRAKPILDELAKNHDVHIVTGSRTFKYLSKYFRAIHHVFNFHIIYRKNSVSTLGIILYNIMRSPLLLFSLLKTIFLAVTLRPQLIISDFDSFTAYAGILLGIPVICIDNQHFVTRTKITYPKRFSWEAAKTRLVTRLLIPTAKLFIITTFSFPNTLPNTRLVPPIIRSELLNRKITNGKHVLVYQTSRTNIRLLRTLRNLPQKFIVYGFGARKSYGNVSFKAFSEEEFYEDLASCKAVITNGGYSLMSEALTLGKPVLSEPVKKQFEQILNGLCLQKEGYGKMVTRIDEMQIIDFLANLNFYKAKLGQLEKSAGVQQTLALIEQLASSTTQRSSAQTLSHEASTLPFQLKH